MTGFEPLSQNWLECLTSHYESMGSSLLPSGSQLLSIDLEQFLC